MDIQSLIGFGAIMAGITVFLVCYAIYAPTRTLDKRAAAIDEVFGEDDSNETATGYARFIQPILRNFMPSLPAGIISEKQESSYRKLIRESGNPWKVTGEELFSLQIALGVLGALAGVFVALSSPFEQIPVLAWPVFIGALAAFFPYAYHTGVRETRTNDIEKNLPEALDLLTVMIRAGQTFEPALRRVTPQLKEGFLRDEFTRMNVELQAGTTLSDCMRSFITSNGATTAESFAKAIIQAQRIGADVTDTLNQQAAFARTEYEARLEKMIAKLGTTLFIPLGLCMLPAFMIIIIAPYIANLAGYL